MNSAHNNYLLVLYVDHVHQGNLNHPSFFLCFDVYALRLPHNWKEKIVVASILWIHREFYIRKQLKTHSYQFKLLGMSVSLVPVDCPFTQVIVKNSIARNATFTIEPPFIKW